MPIMTVAVNGGENEWDMQVVSKLTHLSTFYLCWLASLVPGLYSVAGEPLHPMADGFVCTSFLVLLHVLY